MKFLTLFLVLMISAQPLQAATCDMDMEKSQETSHHMDHSDQDGHECCDSDQIDPQEGCDGEMNCGFCSANVSTFTSSLKFSTAWGHQYSWDFLSGAVLPSHTPPPFRPPIS